VGGVIIAVTTVEELDDDIDFDYEENKQAIGEGREAHQIDITVKEEVGHLLELPRVGQQLNDELIQNPFHRRRDLPPRVGQRHPRL